MKPIDYLPLSSVVSFADIRAYFKQTGRLMFIGGIVMWVIVLLIALAGPFPTILGLLFGRISLETAVPSLVGLVFMGFLLSLVSYAIAASATQSIRLRRFAAVNGFQFVENIRDPQHGGMIFDQGDSRVEKLGIIIPTSDGREIEIGNHEYVIGSGKNRRTVSFGFVRICLSRQLPHMVLDAKSNNFLGMMSNLPDTFNRSQRLSLEGDFDNYFSLYAPQQYERDALYVLTPNIMALLIDKAAKFDMEIVDSDLFLYRSMPFQLHKAEEFGSVFGLAASLSKELNEQTDYYADEKIGNRTVNIVAEPGRRLKKSFSWGLVLVALIYILYFVLNIVGAIND